MPGGTKMTAVYLSPATEHTLGRAATSGFWAMALKAAGYDGVIVTGAADLDAYSNPLSLLYLTIVGLWVVPGTHRDALFAAHATLLDVATGYLYASAEAEGRGTLVRPLLFIDDDEAIARARREALIALRDELVKRIRRTAR